MSMGIRHQILFKRRWSSWDMSWAPSIVLSLLFGLAETRDLWWDVGLPRDGWTQRLVFHYMRHSVCR